MRTLFVLLLILANGITGITQTTFHLENGDLFETIKYDVKSDHIIVEGKSIKKSDILYFEYKDALFVFNEKKGKKLRVRLNESPETSCGKAKLYAYRFYNTQPDFSKISTADSSLIGDQTFRKCYTENVKKIKASHIVTNVLVTLCKR